jgi:hypothetical protein
MMRGLGFDSPLKVAEAIRLAWIVEDFQQKRQATIYAL